MERKKLLELQNNLRNQFQVDELKAAKAGVDAVTRTKMRQDAVDKLENLEREYGDDLHTLNRGESINFPAVGDKFTKIKKALKPLPLAGVAIAALSGDPAMAAEEVAQDAMGPAGLAYEAIRPETAGSAEDDQMMIAEREALENYENSPAGQASKFAKIRAKLGQ
jgi:hypothetical protein